MVDRVLDFLTERISEVLELLQLIDGDTVRQMEQEMDRIQQIVDNLRANNDNHT